MNVSPAEVVGRSMVVRKLPMVQVRMRRTGLSDRFGPARLPRHRRGGCEIGLPEGLGEADKLPSRSSPRPPRPNKGEHDENISFDRVVEDVGAEQAAALRTATLDIYSRGRTTGR